MEDAELKSKLLVEESSIEDDVEFTNATLDGDGNTDAKLADVEEKTERVDIPCSDDIKSNPVDDKLGRVLVDIVRF